MSCRMLLGAWALSFYLVVASLPALAAGLSERRANGTLAFPQEPLVVGYQLPNAFGTQTFSSPLALAVPPDETNRIFVLEKGGRIQLVTNLGAPNPTKTQYMDLRAAISTSGEQGLLGLSFHPNFQNNGFFYIYRSVTVTNNGNPVVTERLSRFQANPPNASTASTATEVILWQQEDLASNHNGGDLHFGPDGYLYISLGDGGMQNDALNNTQTLRKGFHAGLLRLDVDQLPGNLPPNPASSISGLTINGGYSVPADNPWVTNSFAYEVNTAMPTNTIRTEYWAVGLRNPWRIAFDDAGNLWCGDVGGGQREEVNLITKGGNYGWAYREGTANGPKSGSAPAGFASIAPIYQYNHGTNATNTGNSITGGRVYSGDSIPDLTGAYLFADYSSGWIWSLRWNGTTVSDFQNLTSNEAPIRERGIVAFGEDPRNRDLLLCDIDSGIVRRLTFFVNPNGMPIPPTLADTGAFADPATLTPHEGIVPYSLNVPFWSDDAIKTRWFSLPNTNLTITWSPTNNWSFPTGSVWIKHFELVTNEMTQQRTRLETRFLVRNSEGVYGATYRWGTNQSNAFLVPQAGLTENILVRGLNGNTRTQQWYYPSRGDCLACHTVPGGLALGFHTAQLNRDHTYTGFPGATGETDNQLNTLAAAGYFSGPITPPPTLPKLANYDDTSASLEWRVRSYLAANCVQCHQPGGLGQGAMDARYHVPLAEAGLINEPAVENFGDPNYHIVYPRSTNFSLLHQRMAGFVGERMPPLATTVPDTNNMKLLAAWIGSLTNQAPPFFRLVNLVSAGAVWRFNDSGANLGTAWRSNNYNDSTWRSGPAQLGFGDGDEATLVTSNRQITTYFRRSFVVGNPASFQDLEVRLMRDDGAVVYLNGVEIFRSNMPGGAISYTTAASASATPDDETTNFYPSDVNPARLIAGTNVIAVEVHQNNATSSDLSFNLSLAGTAVISASRLAIAPNPNGFMLSWPVDEGFFDVYAAPGLQAPVNWQRVNATATRSNNVWTIQVPNGPAQRYFRLQNN